MRAHRLPLPPAIAEPARPAQHGRRAPPLLVAALAAIALGIVLVTALDLNRPWLKRHVQAFIQTSSGLALDYDQVHLHLLWGLEVDGLVVHSPPGFRAFTPDLLRAGRVDVRWSRSSLFGHGPRIDEIALRDVALTVIVDEHGRSSLDAIRLPPAPPLSHRPGQLLASAPLATQIDFTRADVTVVWTREGRVVERDRIRGLEAAVAAQSDRDAWRLRVTAGPAGTPLDLIVTQERNNEPAGAARARLSLAADLTVSALSVACDLSVVHQSFVPNVEMGDWHVEASARFDPDARRTIISLDRVQAAAGAATAEALLEVPDEGDPLVRYAQGSVDVARVLGWIPAGIVPVVAEHAQLHYRLESAVLGHPFRLAEGGSVQIEADLSHAKVRTPAGVVDVDKQRLVFDGRPSAGSGVAVRLSQQIEGARAESPRGRLEMRDVAIDLNGQRGADGALTGRLGFRFAGLREEGGAGTVVARDGQGELRLERAYVGGSEPLWIRGDVGLSGGVASLDVRLGASRVSADSFALAAHGRLEGRAPYGGDVDASAAGVQIYANGKRLVARERARVGLRFRDLYLDVDRPLASRGVVRASIDFDQCLASLDAVKQADSIAYSVRAAARSLKVLRPFLSSPLAEAAAWDAMGVVLNSSGRLERIASGDPQLKQDTVVDVDWPAFGRTSARSLSLTLHAADTTSHHQVVASVHLAGLAIDGTAPSDDTVTLSGEIDRGPRWLHLQAGIEGRASAKVDASASFDRVERALVYDIGGQLAGLAPVAPLLARMGGLHGFDLSGLALGFSARGTLRGVVSNVGSDGTVELEPHPLRTAAIDGTTEVHVAGLRWAHGATALEIPAAVLHTDMRADGPRRSVVAHVDVDSMRLRLGRHQVDLAGLSDDVTATVTGDLQGPTIALTQRATLRVLQQDFVPQYPVGNVTLALSAQRDADGLLRVSSMELHNGRGGTTLSMEGGVGLGGRRRHLSMNAEVAQDLEPLSAFPDLFAGRGKVHAVASVESPDMALFRTRLDLSLAGVSLQIPGAGMQADSVDGEIPISVLFDVGHGEVMIRRDVRVDPFANFRFADRHPLMRRSGFLSIGRLTTPGLSISPFVGNLAVEQNLVSLRQFEMGVRGGWLVGECALEWNGASSTLDAHVRVKGVRSSRGEPLDGNVEVVVVAGDRMIEGRAEVLSMGKRHLLDLLDMEDPLRVDAHMNRVRTALDWGYPKQIRVAFDNGFANAHLELGGLAQFMSLGDLRGIPTGPIVDRLVEAVLDGKAKP